MRKGWNKKEGAYQSAEEVNENEETHGEETESAKLGEEYQLAKVVNGGVDPTAPLGEQHALRLGGDRVCDRVGRELRLKRGKIFEEQGR